MPNENERKAYGQHEYESPDGMGDCKFGCGCYMGNSTSNGPAGIDPFGVCPKNPIDGKLLGEDRDRNEVIEQWINDLTNQATTAEARFKSVEPGAKKLALELKRTKAKLAKRDSTIWRIREALKKG